MTSPEAVVVVGTSIGAVKTVQGLRDAGFSGEIVVVGAESGEAYDKPPLSKGFLSGAVSESDIALLGPDGWSELGVTAILGAAATALEPLRRRVHLADGRSVEYGHLVIATGARARQLANDSGGVVAGGLRTLDDAKDLRAAIAPDSSVTVIGGGFVGAEVAATVRQLGCATTIVEATDAPFARVIGPVAGRIVADAHTAHGVQLISGVGVTSVERLGKRRSIVRLADGRRLETDVVLAAIGVIPNTEWLVGSGATIDNGVVTDEFCRVVGLDDVYAVGDAACWFDTTTQTHRRAEHWTNAADQAAVVAKNIAHQRATTPYVHAPYFWSDQFDLKIQMVGEVPHDGGFDLREYESEARRRAIVYTRGDQFISAVTFNWPRAMVALRRISATNADAQAAHGALTGLLEKSSAPISIPH